MYKGDKYMKITNDLHDEIGLEDIKTYRALPCTLSDTYYINDVWLNESDFGDGDDNRDYDTCDDEDIARLVVLIWYLKDIQIINL